MTKNKLQQKGTHEYATAQTKTVSSVQEDLFNYLKPEQQEFIKPVLKVLRRNAQKDLCYSLLEYLETGDILPPADITTGALFYYLTRAGGDLPDDSSDKRIIRPLHYRSKPVHRVREIISTFFGQLRSINLKTNS